MEVVGLVVPAVLDAVDRIVDGIDLRIDLGFELVAWQEVGCWARSKRHRSTSACCRVYRGTSQVFCIP